MKPLAVARENAVRILQVPGRGSLSRKDLSTLAVELEAADKDSRCAAVLLLGSRSEFCSGLDLDEFDDEAGLDQLADVLRRSFVAFALLGKPLVIAVEGLACGFGATMLCHADVVVASQRTRVRMPFVDLGLLPEAGSTLLLSDRVGHLNAFRLLCLGEEIDAHEARRIGLVTEVVADDRVAEVAMKAASGLARRSPELVAATRLLMRRDRGEVTIRIDVEVAACIERLRDPKVRRRIARFASAARQAKIAA